MGYFEAFGDDFKASPVKHITSIAYFTNPPQGSAVKHLVEIAAGGGQNGNAEEGSEEQGD